MLLLDSFASLFACKRSGMQKVNKASKADEVYMYAMLHCMLWIQMAVVAACCDCVYLYIVCSACDCCVCFDNWNVTILACRTSFTELSLRAVAILGHFIKSLEWYSTWKAGTMEISKPSKSFPNISAEAIHSPVKSPEPPSSITNDPEKGIVVAPTLSCRAHSPSLNPILTIISSFALTLSTWGFYNSTGILLSHLHLRQVMEKSVFLRNRSQVAALQRADPFVTKSQ